MTTGYPERPADRDQFVLDRRSARDAHDPFACPVWLIEDEPRRDGSVGAMATVFLIGRECPWKCVMCDLWRHTLETDTPTGAIPMQLALALDAMRSAGPLPAHIKLYNAASFFDPHAVPPDDYGAIAAALRPFAHVIVESHPALVNARVDAFRQLIAPASLEVALGLETAHPSALERTNKRATVDDFQRAAGRITAHGADLRVFVLVRPPFIADTEQDEWLLRTIHTAFDAGADVVSMIPTRAGNGALDALATTGSFRGPSLSDIERALSAGLAISRGRVFVDTWDLGRFSSCPHCRAARHERLAAMNAAQAVAPPISCDRCGGSA